MKFRGDIQGARGVGVLIILLAHVGIAQLHGGYVLVDLFFAVSGLVITSTLIAEHKNRLADGRRGFSLTGFYIRRLKRIFPIATLGIVSTVALAQLVWNEVAARRVLTDGIWAFFSLANFHEISKATDYFAQNVSHSPLQHYWTLAVEEQFYLLWPLLMLLAIRIAGGKRDWRAAGLIVVTPIFAASLGYSIYFSSQNAGAAYFSTFTHAWELAAGAMLAFAYEYPRFVAWFTPPVRVSLVFLGGWAVVITTAFVFPVGIAYPGAAALIPILGTLALVACGAAQGSGAMALVDNKVLRYFGDISFSLYVFHWPVVVFTRLLLPGLSPGMLQVVQVSLSIAVAALAYAFVERPLRGLPIGIPASVREDFRAKRREIDRATRKQAVHALIWTACATLLAAGLTSQVSADAQAGQAVAKPRYIAPDVVHVQPQKISASQSGSQSASSAGSLFSGIVAERDPVVAGWLRDLVKSAADTSGVATAGQRKSWSQAKFTWNLAGWSCEKADLNICTVGDPRARVKIFIVGDSHAFQFADGLKKFVRDEPSVAVTMAAQGMCPFSFDPAVQYPRSSQNTVSNLAKCAQLHRDLKQSLSRHGRFALAIVADAASRANPDATPSSNQIEAATRIRNSLPVSIGQLKQFSDKVVMLNTLVDWRDPIDCLSSDLSNWRTCSGDPKVADASAKSYESFVAGLDVRVLHLAPLLCTSTICPLFLRDVVVTLDSVHISQELSLGIVPVLVRQVQALK